MYKLETKAGDLLKSKLIDGVGGVVHGFGVRGKTHVEYLDALGQKDRFIVETNQIHGNTVHYLMWPKKGPVLEGDAFITDRPGLVCFIRTADCVPLLIVEKTGRAVAAIHAGWRGTVEDVVGVVLRAMQETFGTHPQDCVAAIGPAICGRCYEVGGEVIAKLSKLDIGDCWKLGDGHVDLKKANRSLLIRGGISAENIDVSESCTFCDDAFNSYRRDRFEDERQWSFVMITGSSGARMSYSTNMPAGGGAR